MTGSPAWLERARCRRLGLPTDWFVPSREGAPPHPRAVAACRACPVGGPDGPCAADRGRDLGLRGDGFVDGAKTRPRTCERCGQVFRARGGAYRWCEWCAGAAGRRGGAA